MAKEQRVFPKEFKLEAVRLAQTSGESMTQISRDIGISDSALHSWRKQCADSDTEAKHALVLDREARKLFVAPIAQASRFFQEQLVHALKTVGKI